MSEYPSLSVKEARIKCKKGHGDLVVINDEEERVFIWHQVWHTLYECPVQLYIEFNELFSPSQSKAMFNGIIIGLAVDLDGSYQ